MDKQFIYRCHDFVQQRPANFRNVKKFHHPRFGVVVEQVYSQESIGEQLYRVAKRQ